jgi:hypothetical protein
MLALVAIASASPVLGWGGGHRSITQAAIERLPAADREFIGPERTALEDVYCKFPDENWPCYGQWGGGVGDPRLPRYPDTRREWDISYYCGWDPVRRVGKAYPHGPPSSIDAAASLFSRAVAELQQNRREDGLRILGAMLHYVQDSGSFPHVQPIHRWFDVKQAAGLCPADYQPRLLGKTPKEAAQGVAQRVRDVVAWTENRIQPLWQQTGIDFAEAKRRATKELLPRDVVERWARVRRDRAAEYQAVAIDCAGECVRACADAMHTAISLAARGTTAHGAAASGRNLVFNPSLETDDGSGAPDGWCVGYLDLADPLGRADYYRMGTHFERHVHQGQHSLLVLRTPAAGLEWRPTWRHAARVEPGQRYRASAWVNAIAATGTTCVALEFYDAAYHVLTRVPSASVAGDTAWRSLTVEAEAPPQARWLRVILHSRGNSGAAWFDDVELARVAADSTGR